MTTDSSTEISKLLEAAVGVGPGPAQDALYTTARVLSLRQSIIGCIKCSLSQTATPVPWEGGPANIAIIGEAPGAEEDRLGRPFVGRAGQLLDRILNSVGLPRSQVAYVNTICCRPPHNDYSKAIDAGAPLACRTWLDLQLIITGAWLLVPVGNQALWATMPTISSGISTIRGKMMWRGPYLFAPTFHPAYALRNAEARDALQFDLARTVEVLKGARNAPVPKSYDPSTMISTLRRPEAKLTEGESKLYSKHFTKHGWVRAYSHWLDDYIVCARDDMVRVPDHIEGVRYTVRELVQLSHFDRSWETARRIHYTKHEFGATIV